VTPSARWRLAELRSHRLAEGAIERPGRLVHQQHPRTESERPGERDPLLLAAGELSGQPVLVTGQTHQLAHWLSGRAATARCPAAVG
jgi:hypothetical protein